MQSPPRTVDILTDRDNVAVFTITNYLEHMQLAATDLQDLIARIGAEHVERRLKIEIEREAQLFGQGLIFFNLENWYSAPWIIEIALKLTGLYDRARRTADKVIVRRNTIALTKLPPAFDNF